MIWKDISSARKLKLDSVVLECRVGVFRMVITNCHIDMPDRWRLSIYPLIDCHDVGSTDLHVEFVKKFAIETIKRVLIEALDKLEGVSNEG